MATPVASCRACQWAALYYLLATWLPHKAEGVLAFLSMPVKPLCGMKQRAAAVTAALWRLCRWPAPFVMLVYCNTPISDQTSRQLESSIRQCWDTGPQRQRRFHDGRAGVRHRKSVLGLLFVPHISAALLTRVSCRCL